MLTIFIPTFSAGHGNRVYRSGTLAVKHTSMKKLLFSIVLCLPLMPVTAQEDGKSEVNRSSVMISAGITVPILCYGSSNVKKESSGFARPGFTIDIQYAYRLGNHAGVAGMLYYCTNRAGKGSIPGLSSTGTYRFAGFMAGPFVSSTAGNRWEAALKLMAGEAKAFTPRLQYGEDMLLNKESAACFAWGGGLALRYGLSDRTFLQLKTDHLNMKPQFARKPGEPGKTEQHIVVMNVDAGIGWRF
jgi:hypothetical protein